MIKEGTVLIARKTLHMTYNPNDRCLTKGRKYIVEGLENDCIRFKSDLCRDHLWELYAVNEDFIIDFKLNKNIRTL